MHPLLASYQYFLLNNGSHAYYGLPPRFRAYLLFDIATIISLVSKKENITFTNVINLPNQNHNLNQQTYTNFIAYGNNSCLQKCHSNDHKILKNVFSNNKMAGKIYYLDEKHSKPKLEGIIQIDPCIKHSKVKFKYDEVTVIFCIIILVIIRSWIALRTNNIFFILYLGIAKIALKKISLDTQLSESLKLCRNHNFFTVESNEIIDKIIAYDQYISFISLSLTKIKLKKKSSFFWLLLLLSGDIEKNPGPSSIGCFQNKKGLHFAHININSLLPKIDELRHFIRNFNIAVLGNTESKLDTSIYNSEIQIEGYELLRCDRNRYGAGVACYIRRNLCFNIKNVFQKTLKIFLWIFSFQKQNHLR